MDKITFTGFKGFEWCPEPIPASQGLPRWWADMPSHTPREPQQFPVGTVRICSPFEDALSAGYLLRLPAQIAVHTENDEVSFTWQDIPGMQQLSWVDTHSPEQLQGLDSSFMQHGIYKFILPWAVTVPEGYACLYTHPLNRVDLPFQSLSGIVDAGYTSPVNIPFMWVAGNGHDGIIDQGTPVAQIIPFKLDEWDHAVEFGTDHDVKAASRKAVSTTRGYRRIYRRKKVWR